MELKKKLLTDGKSNVKTAKNSLSTYYLSLQPASLNSKGVNLCKFSTKECRSQCLQYAGRQSFSNVVQSRERKTEFFVNDRKSFLTKLWKELEVLNKKGKCAVRLNLLSDIDWEVEFLSADSSFDIGKLTNIQFYDYTKDFKKIQRTGRAKNYHLTFSFSGYNWDKCEEILLKNQANVAVVFKNSIPLSFNKYKVINGDLSDERFLDEKGVIVGLKYKTPKGIKYKENKFIIHNEKEEDKKS